MMGPTIMTLYEYDGSGFLTEWPPVAVISRTVAVALVVRPIHHGLIAHGRDRRNRALLDTGLV